MKLEEAGIELVVGLPDCGRWSTWPGLLNCGRWSTWPSPVNLKRLHTGWDYHCVSFVGKGGFKLCDDSMQLRGGLLARACDVLRLKEKS